MGILNTASGLGKTALATVAYPFAALGTGVRAGVADMVGAPRPTDTAADSVAALGAEGVGDLAAEIRAAGAGIKNVTAGAFGLTPSAPPTVIGQKPAAPVASPVAAPVASPTAPTPEPAAIGAAPPATTAAPAAPRGNYTDFNTPGVTRAGVTPPVTAPVATAATPTMDASLVEQRQNLLAQIANAQSVVQAGSNRDGYKMGDVTKGIATMQALAPLVASTNNLIGVGYGADTSVLNHAADNATRVSLADAGNATELAKAELVGQYGVAGHKIAADANLALAQQKAALEAASPQGQAQLAEAMIKARILKDTEHLNGVGRAMALQGKYNIDQVKDGMTGNMLGAFVNGEYAPAQALGVQSPVSTTKKK